MPESKFTARRCFRAPWLPIWSLFLGIVFATASAIGGNLGNAAITLAAFVVFSAFLYFGARNETIGGLAEPRRDERWEMINQRATAFAGTVLVLILVVGSIVGLVQGDDGSPYIEVLGAGAIAYFAGALWLRSRS
ncbi:MAG TPA: hypothetical protein VH501_00065 [Solirubrobacterales bacterium]|jgi:hypothetical protein